MDPNFFLLQSIKYCFKNTPPKFQEKINDQIFFCTAEKTQKYVQFLYFGYSNLNPEHDDLI